MICVECCNPDIKTLYSKYNSEYIRLTKCSVCGKIADKYSEYDNVILFLDILLLKKQAYRHLAMNVTEQEFMERIDEYCKITQKPKSERWSFSLLLHMYTKLYRLIFITILFEVYLMWAYEEKKQQGTSPVVKAVLEMPVPVQYGYFILQVLFRDSILFVSIVIVFNQFLQWNTANITNVNIPKNFQSVHNMVVLLVTILVSSSVKLFPIIMLIWPYDNLVQFSQIIYCYAIFNTIEALRMVTKRNFSLVSITVASANLISHYMSSILVQWLMSLWLGLPLKDVVVYEWQTLLATLKSFLN